MRFKRKVKKRLSQNMGQPHITFSYDNNFFYSANLSGLSVFFLPAYLLDCLYFFQWMISKYQTIAL